MDAEKVTFLVVEAEKPVNKLIRQLGGVFGITLANTYVARAYAQHRADLVAHLDPGNPLLTERLRHLGSSLQQGYRILDLQVDKQAYLLHRRPAAAQAAKDLD